MTQTLTPEQTKHGMKVLKLYRKMRQHSIDAERSCILRGQDESAAKHREDIERLGETVNKIESALGLPRSR